MNQSSVKNNEMTNVLMQNSAKNDLKLYLSLKRFINISW